MSQGTPASTGDHGVRIGLSAVVMAMRAGHLCVLTTAADPGTAALPFGPFDPLRDRTFELALRAFVTAQTGFRLGFVEQLYTFGDAGRASPRATPGPERLRDISVGYLALTRDVETASAADARWTPMFDVFPWEDRRNGRPPVIDTLADALLAWSHGDPGRRARAETLFALIPDHRWNEERVLDRYELLYEAGLVAEAARDQDRPAQPAGPTLASSTAALQAALGLSLASDHRRILATGLGRLRSKLKYRPVLFELTPETFTLSRLQAAAEAVSGVALHKQNFRRGVERTGLVTPTGQMSTGTGGRPAELYRRALADGSPRQASQGLPLPALR